MGAGGTKLAAQAPPEKSLIAAAVTAAPLTLELAKETADDALSIQYQVGGAAVVGQVRNHLPHNAISLEQAANGLPFTGAVPAPATVHYVDAHGKTAAVLLNGPNGNGQAGAELHTHAAAAAGFSSVAFCGSGGYRNGEGVSVLYSAEPYAGFDQFFDALPTTPTEANTEQCAICYSDKKSPLKMLGCNHAYHEDCIKEWLAREPTCPTCRRPAGPTALESAEGSRFVAGGVQWARTFVHGANKLRAIGLIKPVLTEKQKCNRGLMYRYAGGVGFYPISPDGGAAEAPVMTFDGSRAKTGGTKQRVAACKEWFGHRPGPSKLAVAAGVDAVVVLALASEFDANRRGIEYESKGMY